MRLVCYDKQPLKILEQSQQLIYELKCCHYQVLNFVENVFKVND